MQVALQRTTRHHNQCDALIVQELDEPEYNHFFVKKVITRALDKHNHEREMASILLSALLGEVGLIIARPKSPL